MALGRVDVDQMIDEVSMNELLLWFEFMEIQPFGYEMENYRSGLVASAIYNTNRTKNTDKIFDPKDFFSFSSPSSVQSVETQESFMRIYANQINHSLNVK